MFDQDMFYLAKSSSFLSKFSVVKRSTLGSANKIFTMVSLFSFTAYMRGVLLHSVPSLVLGSILGLSSRNLTSGTSPLNTA